MNKITFLLTSFSLNFLSFSFNAGENLPAYKNSSLPIDQRVEDLLSRMTLEEKIDMLGGTGFATKPIERLEIPELNMADGPLGVRWGNATAFPSGIMMAATWNPEIISKLGSAIANETKAHKRHVILAPCVNIARLPMGGRNFESFGEDPHLTSRFAVEYIKGVQKENIAATVKHFAVNNQEHERDFINTIVDERTLNEIYFPAFKAAVEEADVLAIMSAYNKLNNHWCSENEYLLVTKLKSEWNFRSLVMSDWGAVHSTEPTFNSGLDLEMPVGRYLNKETILTKVQSGELKESELNDKIRRVLYVMFKIGLFDNYKYDESKLNTEEHKQTALDVAKEGIVLLKNENSILPLDLTKIKSIAVIGPNSSIARTGGGGSSMVSPFYSISPLEALQNKIGTKVKINFAQGCMLNGDSNPIDTKYLFIDEKGNKSGLKAEYYSNINLQGTPVITTVDKQVNFKWEWGSPFENFPADNFSARWSGYIKVDKPGRYEIEVSSDDGVRMYFEDELVINDWNDHAVITNSFTKKLEANKFYKIKLEYYEHGGGAICKLGWRLPDEDLFTEAINAGKNSDVVLFFGGTNYSYESEGYDRKDLSLPGSQDKLINEILKVNNNVIIVIASGSPVLMNSWINNIKGLLQLWFAGEQAGDAIAEVLLGSANPSGKLPITFPQRWEDCSAYNSYLKEHGRTEYSDGIYVGYRHFEKNKIKPLFPFGFGLSYTTFLFEDLNLSSNEINVDDRLKVFLKIKNTGKVSGDEVVQLYIRDINSSVDRPGKELKAFKKIHLTPEEEKIVSFEIDKDDLSFFDIQTSTWIAEPGEFMILIGNSSDNILLQETFTLK